MAPRRLAEVQPDSFAFTAENLAWAKDRIAKYPQGRQASAVIPLLWRAQEQAGGWLPQKAMEHVGELLGMARIRVLELAAGRTPKSGPQIDRQLSAPVGGPTTLTTFAKS